MRKFYFVKMGIIAMIMLFTMQQLSAIPQDIDQLQIRFPDNPPSSPKIEKVVYKSQENPIFSPAMDKVECKTPDSPNLMMNYSQGNSSSPMNSPAYSDENLDNPIRNLNVNYIQSSNRVLMDWKKPVGVPFEGWVSYVSGVESGDAMGSQMTPAIRFLPEYLQELEILDNQVITSLSVGLHSSGVDQITQFSIKIWQGGETVWDFGELMYEQAVDISSLRAGMNNINLNTPFPIDITQNLLVGYTVHFTGGTPCGVSPRPDDVHPSNAGLFESDAGGGYLMSHAFVIKAQITSLEGPFPSYDILINDEWVANTPNLYHEYSVTEPDVYNCCVVANYTSGNLSESVCEPVDVNPEIIGHPIRNLEAGYLPDENAIAMSWSSPYNFNTYNGTISYASGMSGGLGLGEDIGGELSAAIRFLPDDLAEMGIVDGEYLYAVTLGLMQNVNKITQISLKIWQGGNSATNPGELIIDQPLSLSTLTNGMNYVLLNTPYRIDVTKEIWIGYTLTNTGGFPVGFDNTSERVVDKSDLFKLNNFDWSSMYLLTPTQISGSFSIQAHFVGYGGAEVTGYDIFVNEAFVGNTTDTVYQYPIPEHGVYNCCVVAKYGNLIQSQSVCEMVITFTEPLLEVSPSTLDFEEVIITRPSEERTISVRGVNLTEGIFWEIIGEDAHAFAIEELEWNVTTGSITEGRLSVVFTPTHEGAHNASILIYSDGAENITAELTGAGFYNSVVIAQWNGYTPSQPPANGVFMPVAGSETNMETATLERDPSGTNFAVNTDGIAASQGWNSANTIEKYWITSFSTEGYENISFTSRQRSSNTGPKDFKVQYKIASGEWIDLPDGTITVANDNYISGVKERITLPQAMNDQPELYLRWLCTSTTAVNSGTVAAGGVNRLDITIYGEVKEPSPDQITFTWEGDISGYKYFYIVATEDEEYTVDWGDGNSSLFIGTGSYAATFQPSPYGDNNNYTVTITASPSCSINKLEISNCSVSALDVSAAKALTHLGCSHNLFTELDLSNHPTLKYLICHANPFTTLNLSNATALDTVYCYQSLLTTLNIQNTPSLLFLSAFQNQLTNLDVSGAPSLKYLACPENQLSSLDVSGLSELQYLYCYQNQLTHLDVSDLSALYFLSSHQNQLTTLDVSNNPALAILSCSNNQLTELNLRGASALTALYSGGNKLQTLDISENTALIQVYCESNQLTELDVNSNTSLLILNCNFNQLNNLDISDHPTLKHLHCTYNSLTSLNLSNAFALDTLICNNNQLTHLDVSSCSSLAYFICNNNQLTTLDVRQNNMLLVLACGFNNLTDIYIDHHILLYCPGNALSLSKLYALSEIILAPEYRQFGSQHYNTVNIGISDAYSLSGETVLGGITTLFEVNKYEGEAIEGIDYQINYANETITFFSLGNFEVKMTNNAISSDPQLPTDVTIIFIVTEGEGERIEFTWQGDTSPKEFQFFATPDETFTVNWGDGSSTSYTGTGEVQTIAKSGYDNPANYTVTITGSTNCKFSALYIDFNSILSLDVTEAPNLIYLYCRTNLLTTLDVSQNPLLKYFECANNQIDALDISNNLSLEIVNVSRNQLSTFDISNNSALSNLFCAENQLTTLNVSGADALIYLSCDYNHLNYLNLTENGELSALHCNNNFLSNLDLSQNAKLTSLYCDNNQLRSLDITHNEMLYYVNCMDNSIPLSNLYSISEQISAQIYKIFGDQQDDTHLLVSGTPFNLAGEMTLGGVRTLFEIRKNGVTAIENVDYKLDFVNETITFNLSGNYEVIMTNNAIVSFNEFPARYHTSFIATPSNDAKLASLIPSSGNLSPTFNPDSLIYTVLVENEIETISITGVANHLGATVDNVVDAPLHVGINSFEVVVTAENGTNERTYFVTVTRKPSSNATLASLTVSSGSLTPSFNPEIVTYSVLVENEITTISITGVANHPEATVDNVVNAPLQVGTNTFEIVVTAEDEVTDKTYFVTVTRKPSSNAMLASLTASSGSLTPSFNPEIVTYSVLVENEITTISITGVASHPEAIVDNVVNAPLQVGTNTFEIVVTAEDEVTDKTYFVTVTRKPSSNATLASLTVSSGSLTPSFNSEIVTYSVLVENEITTISITGVANHPEASVENVVNAPLEEGVNPFEIVVTAEDGTTTMTYTVRVVRGEIEGSDDATLASLTVSSGSLSPTFNPEIVTYSVLVENEITTISITGVANHPEATVGNVVNAPLQVGTNTFEIVVIAEDAVTSLTYFVTVTRKPSFDATLASLTVSSGSLTPTFNPEIVTYSVLVENEITTISITGVANHPEATVENVVNAPLQVGTNTFEIVVTAEDEVSDKTYFVTVTRKPSIDATLASLTVSSGSLSPTFNPSILFYTVEVGNEISTITITGVANHSEATVENVVNAPLQVGVNSFEIVVTAEDGTTTKSYSVHVIREVIDASNDATLASLTVSSGSLSPTFNPDSIIYTVLVENEIETITITGVANHPRAIVINVEDAPLSVGNNQFSIVVIAEDMTTINVYTVVVIRESVMLSNDATLASLTVTQGELTPLFSPTIFHYTVFVDHEVQNIGVTGTANHLSATVIGNIANASLSVGANLFNIIVIAEDGSLLTYEINVYRGAADFSNDATLSSLTTDHGELSPLFNPAIVEYTLSVDYSVDRISLTGTANHAGAIVMGNVTNAALSVGNNSFNIVVVAEDGITVMTYTIVVVREPISLSNDATLSSLTTNVGALTPSFDPNRMDYTVNVRFEEEDISIIGTPNNSRATVLGNVTNASLNVGSNSFSIVVIAEDGLTIAAYTITVIRAAEELSNDATLSRLSVNQGTLTPEFNPSRQYYSVYVGYEVERITVAGIANHAGASLVGNVNNAPLNVGSNSYSIIVIAEDGVTIRAYKVVVYRAAAIPSNDATLASLTVNPGMLTPLFNIYALQYTVHVDNEVENITITGTANYVGANVIGNVVDAPLNVGSNLFNITVVAEDGVTIKNHEVVVYRAAELSNDATLVALTSDRGVLTPHFNPAILEYVINVENEIQRISLTGIARHSAASVIGNVNNAALSVGANTFQIVVTAEDGTSVQTYTIVVNRAVPGFSNDATLASLSVNQGMLSPVFNPATLSYNVTVSNDVENINITGVANHPQASLIGNVTNAPLNVGGNLFSIVVTAEDGTTTLTYMVVVTRRVAILSNDASLTTLTVNQGQLSPVFNPTTLSYEVVVNNAVDRISISGVANHTAANVIGNVVDAPLNVGDNPFNIIVVAEDGTTINTYVVVVTREAMVLSNNANLISIVVNQGALTPAFNPSIVNYSVRVPYNVENISITGTAQHAGATVFGNVTNTTLNVGENPFNISVIAENGTTIKTYTVIVTREAFVLSNDATLASLTINPGTLTPPFHSATLNYTVSVNYEVETINITGSASHSGANVMGNVTNAPLTVGSNTFNIVVIAEDGNTVLTYSVEVIRAALVLSNDATLASLSVNQGFLIPAFNPATLNYSVSVGNDIENITITGTANHAGATVLGNVSNVQLNVGNNLFNIIVVAENGSSILTYSVVVTRAAIVLSNDATLASLTVNQGVLTPAFSPGRLNYSVAVDNDIESITINGSSTSVDATVLGNVTNAHLNVGNNPFHIIVIAEDGTTITTYTVTVNRAEETFSNNASLTTLTVSQGALSPAFNPTTLNYSVNVGNETENISITGVASHPSASVYGNVTNAPLHVGDNLFNIIVIAENGTTVTTYTVVVTRAAVTLSADATLSSLYVNWGVLSPTFDPATFNYTVSVGNDIENITITGTPTFASATVLGNVTDAHLNVGDNPFNIIVIAEDGATILTYLVIVNRETLVLSNDATLSSLTVNQGILTPTFNPTTFNYTVIVENEIDNIEIVGTANHAGANVIGNVTNANLAVGNNSFTIVTIAEDGVTTLSYTVMVTRKSGVGIDEQEEISLTVYPNPTLDKVNIKSGRMINTVEVYDMKGSLILSKSGIYEKEIMIDFSNYIGGAYFVRVNGEIVKIVKQ